MKRLLLILLLTLSYTSYSQDNIDVLLGAQLNDMAFVTGRIHYTIDSDEVFSPHVQFAINSNQHINFKTTFRIKLEGKESNHIIRVFPFWYNRHVIIRGYNTPIGLEYESDFKKLNKIFITTGANYFVHTNQLIPYVRLSYKVGTLQIINEL